MSLAPQNKAGPRLGRGLAALLGDGEATRSEAAALIRSLPVEALEPGPFQPRVAMDPDALRELADSIRQQGVLQPILARPHPEHSNQYQIIGGERRWRAAQQAGLHEVPVYLRTLSDADAMAAALVENLQREDLNPLEEAEGYRRLIEDHGLRQEALADAVGKSRSHVANSLRLLHLPTSIAAEVRTGRISPGHARALLAHPDPELLLPTVLAKNLTVRQLEDLVQTARTPAPIKPATKFDDKALRQSPELAALERELAERLGLKVDIVLHGSGGFVRLHYRDLDQLDGLLLLLRPE